MGIPRFYRWLSERYPLINEFITAEQIPEFDNLYLDMNGIIHNCSHNNTGGLCVKDEGDVFVEVFNYIVRLFGIIRPRKLVYLAVDGCAPRAKMNQQRSRRFRAANDAREAREKALEMGEEISGTPFDSNCITPGTEFMGKLTKHLRFFICKKIQEDPLWQGLDVVLSGPDVPGEGEHKIMDYIRCAKAQPGYDPNLRHCLYGLDADLIMLALASHEPHFALLREEVVFGRQATKKLEQRLLVSKSRFQLLHISLVREYIDLEFAATRQAPLHFDYRLERIIDDVILFCVLVGNDFLPCLPFAEIGDGGLDALIATYKEHLQAASASRQPWLTGNCGEVQFDQLTKFLKMYAETENDKMEAAVEDQSWVLGKRRTVGPQEASDPELQETAIPLETPPNADLARVQYYDVKFQMDVNSHEGTQARRCLFRSYLEGLQWVLYYYFRGPDNASWSWYYPYYHAPMVVDLVTYDEIAEPKVQFDVNAPFQPFQQLMAVLPANSKVFLPPCYQWLFDSPESPILHFYPQRFQIDVDGVKVPWGGVTLIPWIDPEALLRAMAEAERRGPPLTDVESARNERGKAYCFRHDLNESMEVCSTMPQRFQGLPAAAVRRLDFRHPALPAGRAHFDNDLPEGCALPAPGFPTLATHRLTSAFESGVQVFQRQAQGESVVVHLHPEGPLVPSEQQIRRMLSAPYVLIDYPMVHRGLLVAVYTAEVTFLPGGRKTGSDASGHADYIWHLMEEWRRRGLAVDFEGREEEQALQHPIAEVRAMESLYVDDTGQLQYRFKSTSEYCSFHLLREQGEATAPKVEALADRLGIGTPVLCIASDSEAFGQMGVVEDCGGSAASLRACFRLGLGLKDQKALQLDIQGVVLRQHQTLRWWSLDDIVKEAHLDARVAKQILGSVLARTAENVREDVGMNLTCELWEGDVATSLCLPAYSARRLGAWMFSDLAVEALKDYKAKFPGLFAALQDRRPNGRDLDLRLAFPDSADADYASRQLVKYCTACPFKQLRLSSEDYMALAPAGIAEVVRLVDGAKAELERQPVRMERVTGADKVYRIADSRSRLPSRLLSTSVGVGQRGCCVDPSGPVPCGVKGTVLGIYGSGEAQLLEVLLDEETFGATDLNGRTPPMRGVQVSAEGFMPHALHAEAAPPAAGAAQAAAAAAKPAAAQRKKIPPRGRWAAVKGGDAPVDEEQPVASSRSGPPMPEAMPQPSHLANGAGGSAHGAGPSEAEAEYWAKKFEELLALGAQRPRPRGHAKSSNKLML